MPSFAIIAADQGQRMRHQNASQHNDHSDHSQEHHYPHEMHHNAQSPVQLIPRAIINVADDLTEQIRISVQDIQLSPQAFLYEANTGGNVSDIHENYENLGGYQSASLAHSIDESEQDVYIYRTPPSTQDNSNVEANRELANVHAIQEHHYLEHQSNTNHRQELITNVSNDNAIISSSSTTQAITVRHSHLEPVSSLQQSSISTALTSDSSQTDYTPTTESFLVAYSSAVAQPRRLVLLGSSSSNHKQQIHSSNSVSVATLSKTSNVASACQNFSDSMIYKIEPPQAIQESSQAVVGKNNFIQKTVQNIDSNNFEQHQNNQTQCDELLKLEDIAGELSFLSINPPLSSHRQAGFITENLYNGSCFKGFQKSSKRSHEVSVQIQHVDFDNSYICGYLCIKDIVKSHPSLTTFFEGEIISKKCPFLTRKWDATEAYDKFYWSKLGFRFKHYKGRWPFDNDFDYQALKDSDYVYMRWKERFLVPDHTVKQIEGASYAGFYYTCFSKRTSQIKGYYFHISEFTEGFQFLNLEHEHQNSSQVYEFR